MASWGEIEAQAPELSARARGYLDAFVHKTLATLRRDGSPRISGSEVIFAEGELVTVSLPDPPTHLIIESWHEGRGVTRLERA
jgi:hypothetical protein